MTNRNGSRGSSNQNSPSLGGAKPASGDNNKGTDYRSKKGSKSKVIHHNK
ncbi:imidazoleglycerol-phosphate dehydratase [Bacillus sp. RG28]|uniref:Imidazoleglycerol-phosphate dehydratase n=1 Tax=Gottfriedia endophytica TaxID=2820819 RepID=A0A940SKL5_9BACI|nr:imidazoleglycerol-phosphate dehydratase [Gottfriedia endophytica]MBP0726154.1 imidazoleglycerol-phosphate dehydratase [Gottfriedia endophytica]